MTSGAFSEPCDVEVTSHMQLLCYASTLVASKAKSTPVTVNTVWLLKRSELPVLRVTAGLS